MEFQLTEEEAKGNSDTSTLIIPMRGQMHKPETGYDTVIAQIPDDLVDAPPKQPGGNPKLSMHLLQLAVESARNLGEGLRLANYWVTRDPEVVKQRGLLHDCPTCRAGVDRAVAEMKEHPGTVMAVGQLSWCQP